MTGRLGLAKLASTSALLIGLTGFLCFLLLSPSRSGSRRYLAPVSGVTMVCLVSSIAGAFPKAQAFVGGGFASRGVAAAFATNAATTAPTTTFIRRAPTRPALSHHWAGVVGATPRPAVLTPPARAGLRRGLTGSPPALLMFASAGGTMQAATTGDDVKHVLVPVADGSEEIESVTIIDTLVRAGAAVTVASVGEDIEVTCSRGVKIKADCKIAECEPREWDAVVCPGGMPGAVHLKENATLEAILKKQDSEGRIFGAICAAPAVVLASHGLLDGRKATCYPADVFTGKIPQLVQEKVVVDGNLVTSQGPATSMAFALQLVDSLFGTAKAQEIASGLLFK